MKENELEKYISKFDENNINGKTILLLKEKDFTDLGITKVGEVIKLRDLIRKIKIYHNEQKEKKKLKK